jgi:hypothetical protein
MEPGDGRRDFHLYRLVQKSGQNRNVKIRTEQQHELQEGEGKVVSVLNELITTP